MEQWSYVLGAYIFLFGIIIGSFLNVVIYRIPLEKDVVFLGSFCPSCGVKIPWYHNIPLISYVVLKGKCYKCFGAISPRYFIVELVTGLFAVYLFPSDLDEKSLLVFFVRFFIFCILWCHFWIDLAHHILPNVLNFYLLIMTIPFILMFGNIAHSFWGVVVGLVFPGSVAYFFYRLRGVEGLGMGDIKLYGVLGLLLGAQEVMLNIFLSCFLGVVVFLVMSGLKKMDKNTPMAFGPYIIIVAIAQLFFPEQFSLFSRFLL